MSPGRERQGSPDAKKMKKEDGSDGERSDADLVVDDEDSKAGRNSASNGNRQVQS